MIVAIRYVSRTALVIMLSTLFFGGCGNSGNMAPVPEATETPVTAEDVLAPEEDTAAEGEEDTIVSSNERIGFITQEYEGENIVEIPFIEYEGETNPEIEAINRLLNQGLQIFYEDFLKTQTDQQSIEIKSYPFTTDDYLQIVITKRVFPNYGTDGEIESINYDRNAKKCLTIENALEMLGLSEEEVTAGVQENFVPEMEGDYIESVKIAGFLIHDIPGSGSTELLLDITVKGLGEESGWKGFYAYLPDDNPNTNDLVKLSPVCLFDPYNMDEMDPPLWYQQNAQ